MLSPWVAVVTGAGGGIGTSCVRHLASAGATVVAVDIDPTLTARIAEEVSAVTGQVVLARVMDVSCETAWSRLMAEVVADHGPVEVLVNNAAHKTRGAVSGDGDVVSLDLDVWDEIFAINLRGYLLGCRAVLPGMIERGGGAIIMTSSIAGQRGNGGVAAYSASKAGVDSLTRSTAAAYGRLGVRCNAVAPGVVVTEANASLMSEEVKQRFAAQHLSPRLGVPDDVGAMVAYLAGPNAHFVNGQIINVDGGLISHW